MWLIYYRWCGQLLLSAHSCSGLWSTPLLQCPCLLFLQEGGGDGHRNISAKKNDSSIGRRQPSFRVMQYTRWRMVFSYIIKEEDACSSTFPSMVICSSLQQVWLSFSIIMMSWRSKSRSRHQNGFNQDLLQAHSASEDFCAERGGGVMDVTAFVTTMI